MENAIFNDTSTSDHAELRRLARSICVKLRLPRDDSLAFVIGSGTELSSESAVVTWLRNNDIQAGRLSFPKACDALQRDLSDRLDV